MAPGTDGSPLVPELVLALPAVLRRRPEIQALTYGVLVRHDALHLLPPAEQEFCHARYLEAAGSNLPRLAALEELLGGARARRLPLVPIKGGALLLGGYEDPGMRPMVDLDVVCRPADLEAASALVTSSGFRPLEHAAERVRLGATHDRRFVRGPVVLELHHRLWHELELAGDVDGLVARAVSDDAGRLVPAAPDHLHLVLVHAALHGFAGNPAWIADALLLGFEDGAVRRAARTEAEAHGTTVPFAIAADLLAHQCGQRRPGGAPALRGALVRALAPWLQRGEPELGTLPSRLVRPLLFADPRLLVRWVGKKARLGARRVPG